MTDRGGYGRRYDTYKDWKTEEEYLSWTREIFHGYEKYELST